MLSARLNEFEAQKNTWQEKDKELNNSLQQLNSLFQEKEKTILKLEEEKDKFALQVKNSESRLSHLNQLDKDKSSLEVLTQDLRSRKILLESKNSELAKTISDKEKAVSDLSRSREELNLKLKGYEARLLQLENEKALLADRLEKFSSQEQLSLNQASVLNNSIQQLNDSIRDKEININELKLMREKLLKQHTRDIWRAEDCESKLTQARKDGASLKSQLERLESEKNSLTAENQEAVSKAQTLSGSLKEKKVILPG